MGSPWTSELKRYRRRVINQTFSALEEQGFTATESDQYVAGEVQTTVATAARWRNGQTLPVGEVASRLEALMHSLKSSSPKPVKASPTRKEKTNGKVTAHSGTVLAVHALVDHLSLSELIELTAHLGRAMAEKQKERNGE